MFDDDKIEVHCFGVTAQSISPAQLEALGADGYTLTHGWSLNEEAYGPNQKYFMFERIDI